MYTYVYTCACSNLLCLYFTCVLVQVIYSVHVHCSFHKIYVYGNMQIKYKVILCTVGCKKKLTFCSCSTQ